MENTQKKKVGGLAGIVAGKSAICTVGTGHGLNYRGYDIQDLAMEAEFEEVAYLLLFGTLPKKSELEIFKHKLQAARHLEPSLQEVLKLIPKDSHPMDMMKTACAMLGCLEKEKPDFSNQKDIAIRLLGVFPSILTFWHHYHHNNISIDTQSQEESIAGYFLEKLHQKPPKKLWTQAMQASLILYAEHEFNASTFTARIVTSTLSDIYSSITAAIGALRGPLHGGANEAAMELISEFSSPEEATKGILSKLESKAKIMGFGHRVYVNNDPRNVIIKQWSKRLAQDVGNTTIFPISEAIEKVMWEEKKLFPNLDFYSASAYHFMGIPTAYFTPIFIMSRTSGWLAHIFEQRSDNKLIRPTSEYIGPSNRAYIHINNR
ncbi:2-methylcitrate synthase [Helicobacter sp. 12S02634-8]|uniref:bifunctional 2-methylcitrate synthase/citrate synthase n=1 Tax=Helicobacter sp. 12S02634-8 TaxID=1476199 RepID=UPI000BA78FE2|nr:2-methylcitrate synthase [Helicobacter sp. 12S02634-8]PAF46440.1 2-methylcitrate synthase [Helicobacter sp. 12S02634-8]